MSFHQALGQNNSCDSGVVPCYTLTCQDPLDKGLKYVYLGPCLPATLLSSFFTVHFSLHFLLSPPPLQHGGPGTNNLLAALELRERDSKLNNKLDLEREKSRRGSVGYLAEGPLSQPPTPI